MFNKLYSKCKAYCLNRKEKQWEDINKVCDEIANSLVQRQKDYDKGYHFDYDRHYAEYDAALGAYLGVLLKLYYGVWSSEATLLKHAGDLLNGCADKAEAVLGKELNKEFKEF
tara:strand:+ start:433 stop:771 length:339 start_codon:yes stop_codon:yes gene_type:complete